MSDGFGPELPVSAAAVWGLGDRTDDGLAPLEAETDRDAGFVSSEYGPGPVEDEPADGLGRPGSLSLRSHGRGSA